MCQLHSPESHRRHKKMLSFEAHHGQSSEVKLLQSCRSFSISAAAASAYNRMKAHGRSTNEHNLQGVEATTHIN
jgi:hypothetical protein